MNSAIRSAIYFVALSSIISGASGEDVYKCGNTYSQKPCPEAVRLGVQDPRTQAQKAEADANTRRDANAANAMEKARLKEEAEQRAAKAKLAAAKAKKAPTKPPLTEEDSKAQGTGKAKKKPSPKKKKEPEFFTARGPTDKPKPVASATK